LILSVLILVPSLVPSLVPVWLSALQEEHEAAEDVGVDFARAEVGRRHALLVVDRNSAGIARRVAGSRPTGGKANLVGRVGVQACPVPCAAASAEQIDLPVTGVLGRAEHAIGGACVGGWRRVPPIWFGTPTSAHVI